MKALLFILLLFSFSFLFGQFGSIQKISYGYGTVTAELNGDYGKWQQAHDVMLNNATCCNDKIRNLPITFENYDNRKPFTSQEFLIMEHSKEYCDIRIEELEKQIEELRQIILNINE